MSTCFLHLLPEAREYFENYFVITENAFLNSTNQLLKHVPGDNQHVEHFPVEEFIVLCGFFATYFLEEIIQCLLAYTRKTETLKTDFRLRFCSCAKRHTECSRTYKDMKLNESLLSLQHKNQPTEESGEGITGQFYAAKRPSDEQAAANSELIRSSILEQPVPNYGTMGAVPDTIIEDPTSHLQSPTLVKAIESAKHQLLYENNISISSIMTVAALSFHSIFEGFAIGFQQTITDTWTLMLAISLHKFVIAFVIGVEILGDGCLWHQVMCYITVFSIMSPIGMIAAIFAQRNVEQMSPLVTGSINCLACGTLLYVTFFEILRRKSHGVYGLKKFCAIAMGAGVMAAVQYTTTVLK